MVFQKGNTINVGKKYSTEHRKNISLGNIGKKVSEESKEKNRQAHLGKKTWNTGLTMETDERVKRNGESGGKTKKKLFSDGVLKPWNIGTKGVMKANSGSFKKGSKGFTGNHTIESREKMHKSRKSLFASGYISPMKGYKPTEETRNKISIANKGRKLTKEHIRKTLRRRPMSSLEVKFSNIIQKHQLPYKFVGNGEFFIERKNPDFININGEKTAIEVYCRKHKALIKKNNEKWKIDYNKVDEWMNTRKEIFERYGWKVLFFDEIQVNEENVLKQLGGE